MAVETDRAAEPSCLYVEHVTKRFYQLTAVDGVSLQLCQGDILGLIGPNGSGKSTLINVITGVLPPTDGRVRLDTTVTSAKRPHAIARQGIVRTFQGVRLFSNLTVLENIMVAALSMGARRRTARERAEHLLERFELTHLAQWPANSLPYGHERIVEVVRSLAMRPKVLCLDEPAAGLDEEEGESLLQKLLVLPTQEQLGLLIVDHDMQLIMRLCQRIHVLNFGRTIAEGTPDEIQENAAVREAYLGSAEGEVKGA